MPSKELMKEFVISLLKNNLSEFYFYHNPEHTLYVMAKVTEIGNHEKCTDNELEFLQVAALWHDTGYIRTYYNHEEESCSLAKQHLPEYGYSLNDIEKICGMIMATKIPQSPTNRLEEIIADADLEYLGTNTVEIKAECLFRELQYINSSLTELKWNQTQISFLQKHHYFTRFCKEKREPAKMVYLNKLEHAYRF